jgi:peptidyl-tRNA hydrolase
MAKCVQYIVVRKDLVPAMGVGKTAAQCCHASLAPLLVHLSDETIELSKAPSIQEWFRGKFTKVVVYVKSKQKLLNLAEKLNNLNIRYKPIHDCCLTCLQPEEEDGTTLTCIGVIPLRRNEVPKCLEKLQLLDFVNIVDYFSEEPESI